MKIKIFTICLLACFLFAAKKENKRDHTLLRAIEIVESGGNPNVKPGDGGRAIGILQLHKIYVDEVNRILGLQKSKVRYTYSDRSDVQKSREMFWIVTEFWIKQGKSNTREGIARRHNGGPQGDNPRYKAKYAATSRYWNKVQKALNKLEQ